MTPAIPAGYRLIRYTAGGRLAVPVLPSKDESQFDYVSRWNSVGLFVGAAALGLLGFQFLAFGVSDWLAARDGVFVDGRSVDGRALTDLSEQLSTARQMIAIGAGLLALDFGLCWLYRRLMRPRPWKPTSDEPPAV